MKSYPHASQNKASAVFAIEQFGQGWVAEVPPALVAPELVPDVTGTELEGEGLLASGAKDPFIGAPHVSQ